MRHTLTTPVFGSLSTDVTPGSSESHMRRTRKQRLKAAVKSGGGVAKGAVGIALNKGMIAGQIAGRAAVGGAQRPFELQLGL